MTVTHSKGLTTLRKRQKRKKTMARLAKEAERTSKQSAGTGAKKARNETAGEKGNG